MSTNVEPPPYDNDTAKTVMDEKTATQPVVDNLDPSLLDPSATASSSRAASDKSALDSQNASRAPSFVSAEAGETIKTPFTDPLPGCKPASSADLTPEQETKYASLLSVVSTWDKIPTTSARNSPTAPITDDERMWLTRECLLRYLRAVKWNPNEAPKRLLATLIWRREYKLETFTPDYISPENETGKQVILGFDNDARPCLYLNPAKQNTQKSERQIQHLVFMLDRVIEMMGPGQETTALLINFKNSSGSSNPSVGQGKQTLTILQGHYPERLGRALISELPWYVTTFFKLISPFIDPVTKSKMKFNEPLSNHVPAQQLWSDYGGEAHFKYSHTDYWPALNAICEEKRKAYKERWVQAGKKVGEYEAYLRGGDQMSLAQLIDHAGKMVDGTDAVGSKERVNEIDNAVAKGVENLKVAE
ncbi:MAG: hypothetical protein M1820_001884 [Bogoriella megaspora]|nr:MAG: hypothetical protein M1820_001884 [Bogoriella megaspora]